MSFATFLIAPTDTDLTRLAATTRAADTGEAGKIGLPGGKVDAGETDKQAVIRESAEEGWNVPADANLTLCHVDIVDGKQVSWFLCDKPVSKLANYKEKHRITPISATVNQVANSGYGNSFISDIIT